MQTEEPKKECSRSEATSAHVLLLRLTLQTVNQKKKKKNCGDEYNYVVPSRCSISLACKVSYIYVILRGWIKEAACI